VDRFDELAVLVAIVDEGSLAAAGRRLRRSPPAITRVLAALEKRTGTRLLERTTRRMAPTEAGIALAVRARSMLADYAAALSELASTPVRGLLRVTAPVQFGRLHVSGIVSGFLETYPDTRIELQLNDRNVDFIDEGIDIALRIGTLSDSGLMARQVGSVRRIVVASPRYLQKNGTPQRPAALAKHAIIFSTTQQRPSEWRFGPGEHGAVVRFTARLAVNDVESQLIAVRAGHGITRLLSYQAAADIRAGTLVRLLEAFEPPSLPVQLVTPSPRISTKVRAFLDYAMGALETLDVIHPSGETKRPTRNRLASRPGT
jgi:DNA-binding transcriptional LysR family regulator